MLFEREQGVVDEWRALCLIKAEPQMAQPGRWYDQYTKAVAAAAAAVITQSSISPGLT